VYRVDETRPPRSYSDYRVEVDVASVPPGVRVIDRLS